MITVELLVEVMPNAAKDDRIARLFRPLRLAMTEYEINTPLRIAAFLAQVAVESGELRYTRELWGPTDQQRRYEPPSSLSARLGNTTPGDGFKYRGRGLIQITGRHNYGECGRALWTDLVTYPELLEQPLLACMSAGWYWHARKINEVADRNDFVGVTRLVNGGLTAINERLAYYTKARLAVIS